MEKETPDKNKKSRKSRIIVFALLGIGAVIAAAVYYRSLRFETTDDAQIDTDITSLTSHVPGYIAQVRFDDNAYVHKGDTLIILDDRELALKEAQAEVSLENAIALLNTTRENTRSVRQSGQTSTIKIDELRILMENTTKDFERYKKLYEEGTVTPQQFDKIRTEKETLGKRIEAAQQTAKEVDSRISAADQQISVSETVVEQRRIELKYAKLNHSYAFITAPFDGIVSKKNAVEGQLIQAGQALCSIISNDNIWVTANFKETKIKDIKEGMKVDVSVDAYPDEIIEGRVASFSSATGSKFSLIPPDNASGNYVKVVQRIPVHIDLDKNNPLFKHIKPGMNVFVKVILN
ncbi:HlyD family secretion protein [Saccharicrinis sp. FJH62]|uniref:HlyD family secretion protein n=1 Tax=Saccharicrinis sp. FJH62 TaxID=3344657 RepID=UPI0035D3E17E